MWMISLGITDEAQKEKVRQIIRIGMCMPGCVHLCMSVRMCTVCVHVFAADYEDTVRKDVSSTLFSLIFCRTGTVMKAAAKFGSIHSDYNK